MISSKTYDKGQKLSDRGNPKLSQDAVKLLKTQDTGYLRTMTQRARRARERLEQDHVLLGGVDANVLNRGTGRKYNRYMLFVETKQQQDLLGSQDTNERKKVDSNLSLNQLRASTDENEDKEQTRSSHIDKVLSPHYDNNKKHLSLRNDQVLRKQRKRSQEVRESRLRLLKLKEGELLAAAQELELQRARSSNSIGGTTRAGVKWKIRERKK